LAHLKDSRGSVVYLSSISSIGPAWPGIGAYTTTKAALNRMVETWRLKQPEVGFTRIFVGPTDGAATGIASGALSTPECISEAVELVLGSASRIWDVAVEPKDPPLPWTEMDPGAVPS
jgi:NAD(P)-dependent dehydrogenase (short-subunit alcohol dehydrogenase family)